MLHIDTYMGSLLNLGTLCPIVSENPINPRGTLCPTGGGVGLGYSMSKGESKPDMGGKIGEVLKRTVPTLVDTILIKTAIDNASKFIEGVSCEDDECNSEKRKVLTLLSYASDKIEEWYDMAIEKIVYQIREELGEKQ